MHYSSRLLRSLALAAAVLSPCAWAAPFTDNHDGTVTDQATGLMWDQCAWGQTFSSGACTGTPPSLTWANALQAAQQANTATPPHRGYTDWRVPNLKELETLVKIDAKPPAIDPLFSPASSYYFWSSTSVAPYPANAWWIHMGTGAISLAVKTIAGTYRVRLVRSGQSSASFDLLARPGAPTSVTAQAGLAGSGEVMVSWNKPTDNHGGPITSYTATAVEDNAKSCSVSGTSPATSCTIEGLPPGSYTFTVTATNGAGEGSASAASEPVTLLAAPPGAPTDVKASPAGSGQVTVTWTPPANTGGGITGYLVTAQPGGQTCTPVPPTATTCTFTGLTDGQTYTFTVEATNDAGSSAGGDTPPTPSNPATPLANPNAFSATGPSGALTVTVSGGGDLCSFEHVQLLPVSGARVAPPANLNFPHGLLDFVLSGCDQSDATVTITYPHPLPPRAQYWKLNGNTWASYAGAAVQPGASMATLTLRDGGPGDDDGQPDGRIVDPGQVAVMTSQTESIASVPALSSLGLGLLGVGLALLGSRRRHG